MEIVELEGPDCLEVVDLEALEGDCEETLPDLAAVETLYRDWFSPAQGTRQQPAQR